MGPDQEMDKRDLMHRYISLMFEDKIYISLYIVK